MLALLPMWAANTIVIIILLVIFYFPVSFMIKNKIKGNSVGCACQCGGKGKSLKKQYMKAKKKEQKQEKCCCQNKEEK